MDSHSATPEDLPALELRPLRRLVLKRPSSPHRPAHVSSASGVVRRGVFAYVIGDDELFLAVFDLSSDRPGELRRVLEGELPDDESERKQRKPDLEALTVVPPLRDSPYGGILGLGSGSTETQDRGFYWPLDADGSLRGEPSEIGLGPLYERLRGEFGRINVEGACVFEDRLWLFHRGNKGDAPNTVAELGLSDLSESLHGDLELDADELRAVRAYELGELERIELCFSDATALFDELVVFTASAEADEDDAAPDGEIRGSVVGTIDAEGSVRRLRSIDPKWKVEGVHAAVEAGVIDFSFVCDQDDPDEPSPLLTATMPLDARFERGG
jgi:hypothetical protein